MISPRTTVRMIVGLSEFLRRVSRDFKTHQVTLAQEMEFLEKYLEIQKVRFTDRLRVTLQVPPELMDAQVPTLLLQPIVENAIKFGLYDTTDAVTITISARAEGRFIRISVQNPFDPETSRPTKGAGFGLSSIQRRLYLLFARTDLLETRIEDHLFTTTVKIPQLQMPVTIANNTI